MSKRRNHDAAFKARVVLETVKRERSVSEPAADNGVHPTIVHQWKRLLLDGATGISDWRGMAAAAAEVPKGTVRDPHAKSRELAIDNDS